MARVFFKPVNAGSTSSEISRIAQQLLDHTLNEEKIELGSYVPLKVHFGEKDNISYIKSDNFLGIIELIRSKGTKSAYIETNALYKGQRQNRTDHLKLAEDHGFTQLPVVIADGEFGDDFQEITIDGVHFSSCKIGKAIAELDQMIVLSHFKGHLMAGFGGALKQLAMGCASRGGKLAQHSNAIPKIKPRKCEACEACLETCPADAITLTPKPRIDETKCIGCASCMAVCESNAVRITWWASLGKKFRERIAEHALAAQKDKTIIYINFILSVTRGCDCESHRMKPIAPDIGITASIDPVAIDTASLDLLQRGKGRKIFQRGRRALFHAQKVGLGSVDYQLKEI